MKLLAPGCSMWMSTRRLGSNTGNVRKRTSLTRVNTEVFAPIPNARAPTANSVNTGALSRPRAASRRSCVSSLKATDRNEPAHATSSPQSRSAIAVNQKRRLWFLADSSSSARSISAL